MTATAILTSRPPSEMTIPQLQTELVDCRFALCNARLLQADRLEIQTRHDALFEEFESRLTIWKPLDRFAILEECDF